MSRRNKLGKNESLCWMCENAVPSIQKCTGCPWSLRFEPVPGWDAEKTDLRLGKKQQDGSYFVKDCPLFTISAMQKSTYPSLVEMPEIAAPSCECIQLTLDTLFA